MAAKKRLTVKSLWRRLTLEGRRRERIEDRLEELADSIKEMQQGREKVWAVEMRLNSEILSVKRAVSEIGEPTEEARKILARAEGAVERIHGVESRARGLLIELVREKNRLAAELGEKR